MSTPPANMVGGVRCPWEDRCTRRVEQVRTRDADSGGSWAERPASHSFQSVTPSMPSHAQPITVSTPASAAAASPRSTVSGPTNRILLCESLRMYAASGAVRWKSTGTVEAPAGRPPRCASAVSAAFSPNTATRCSSPSSPRAPASRSRLAQRLSASSTSPHVYSRVARRARSRSGPLPLVVSRNRHQGPIRRPAAGDRSRPGGTGWHRSPSCRGRAGSCCCGAHKCDARCATRPRDIRRCPGIGRTRSRASGHPPRTGG